MKLNEKAFKPLDDYEKQLIEDLENDQFQPIQNEKKEMKRYQSYFKAMPKKDKRISIRVAQQDLLEIQKKATDSGIPYQTLVSAILHQYAKGNINVGV
ncbi:MAG: antitoxin [bacterium]|nr:antitoxin [bacterium]